MGRRRRNAVMRTAMIVQGPEVRRTPPAFSLAQLGALRAARDLVKSLEDRRQFHPLGDFRPVSSVRRASRRFVIPKASSPFKLSTGIAFAVPREVSVCVRRRERREVLHALKKVGAGSRARYRRRNYWSSVSC